MTSKTDTANLPAVPDTSTAVDILSKIGSVESEWNDLDDLDMAPDAAGIPVIKINRKTDGTGGIKISGEEDPTEHIAFVWAARGLSRVRFDGPYDPKNPPKVDCRSVDGLAPDDHQPLWMAKNTDEGGVLVDEKPASCTLCPYAYENGGDCKKNMEALVYLQEPGDTSGAVRVARFRFGGLAYKSAKNYWDSFRYRIPKIPSVAYVTEMTLEKEKTDNGIFFVPHFERAHQLTREEADVFITDARARTAQWRSIIAEDLADQTGDVAAAEAGPFDDAQGVDPATGEIIDAEEPF